MFEILVLPGDLIVNRIPEEELGYRLGYKLGAGRVIKSGIPNVKEGEMVIFGLADAREWDFPVGLKLDFTPSPLGCFQLREGGLRALIRKRPEGSKPGEPMMTIYGE